VRDVALGKGLAPAGVPYLRAVRGSCALRLVQGECHRMDSPFGHVSWYAIQRTTLAPEPVVVLLSSTPFSAMRRRPSVP